MTERVLGPRRSRRRRTRLLTLTALLGTICTVLFVAASSATLSGGSTFESGDGNLAVNGGAGFHDWNSPVDPISCGTVIPGGGANCGLDLVKNKDDNSLGQGAKEDDPAPTVVSGAIPPSKDDLSRFYVNKERVNGNDYLYLAWERSNLLGSAHMDFEFNQSSTPSANGVTPVRTGGDLLIDFDFGGSGVPVLAKHTWITTGNAATDCEASNTLPCWDKAVNLGAFAEAQVNSAVVSDANPPNAPFDLDGNTKNGINSTFGEAGINLTGSGIFPPGVCEHFGAAYLKSRSSGNSFSSELKDFIAPIPVNITNCGTVNIHKQDDLGAALQGAVFTLYNNVAPLTPPHGAGDTATTLTCTTAANGDCSIANVPFGNYLAVETTGVAGHDLAPDQAFSLTSSTPNLTISLTFVDPRQKGAILITKNRKHAADGSGDHPHAGVTFTLTPGGATAVTDANGQACFGNLTQGSYTVTETVPAGYHLSGSNGRSVSVDQVGTCTSNPETVTFTNIPLTDITVSVNSQVDGGTSSTISNCASGIIGAGPPANGDGSASATNLEPGTYTCTVVIDP
jgi:hypothetical protein